MYRTRTSVKRTTGTVTGKLKIKTNGNVGHQQPAVADSEVL